MDTRPRPTATARTAAEAVADYAMISLQEQFLLWEKDVNMQVAEFVWNAGGENLDACAFSAPGPELKEMVRTLARARRSRWGTEDFLLLCLDVRVEGGEIAFTFDLSWDEGETFTACEIVVEGRAADRMLRN